MLFEKIIPDYTENNKKTHAYKMYSYWLLKQVVHVVTTGL
jgi:hypothetical protein